MSWMKRTGQIWKYYVMLGTVVLTFLSMIKFIQSVDKDSHISIYLFVFIGFFALTIYWLVFSIKCPGCKKPIMNKAMSESSLSTWIDHLLTFEQCPYCGNDGHINSAE